jgi:hypothetical protein
MRKDPLNLCPVNTVGAGNTVCKPGIPKLSTSSPKKILEEILFDMQHITHSSTLAIPAENEAYSLATLYKVAPGFADTHQFGTSTGFGNPAQSSDIPKPHRPCTAVASLCNH